MKFLFLLTVFISLVVTEKIHYAVLPLDGFEQYYLDTRNSKHITRRQHYGREIIDEKTEACSAILRSPLFRTRYQCGDPVDLHDPAVYDELKKNHPNLFKLYYIRYSYNSVNKNLNFVNPYNYCNVTVKNEIRYEPVFSCLSRKNSSKDVIEFLISSQYDINEDMKHHKIAETVKGRFIFRHDSKERVVVIALAQVPPRRAINETDYSTEAVEAAFRKENNCSGDAGMYQLNAFQRIRLCTAIFSAEIYRDKFTFLPDSNNEPPCMLRKLYFRHQHHVEGNASKSEDYSNNYKGPIDEWMISCKGRQLENNEPIIRYVIRGSGLRKQGKYDKYYVGVEEIENRTFLESYLYKVGITLQKTK